MLRYTRVVGTLRVELSSFALQANAMTALAQCPQKTHLPKILSMRAFTCDTSFGLQKKVIFFGSSGLSVLAYARWIISSVISPLFDCFIVLQSWWTARESNSADFSACKADDHPM